MEDVEAQVRPLRRLPLRARHPRDGRGQVQGPLPAREVRRPARRARSPGRRSATTPACGRGCHSERLLEGEISSAGSGSTTATTCSASRRGMQLRCTSCHSQIVQGEPPDGHAATCVLCHFKEGPRSEPIADVHAVPRRRPRRRSTSATGVSFLHARVPAARRPVRVLPRRRDARARARSRGSGAAPATTSRSTSSATTTCAFLHRHHVTEHSVNCLECHTEIRHGLPPREQHYRGDCKDCHTDTHGSVANLVRGTGGRGVADEPGAMYLARVTCNGCHRAPVPGRARRRRAAPRTRPTSSPASTATARASTGWPHRWQAEARARPRRT